VSTSIFEGGLPRPAVEEVVVVDGLIASGALHAADELIPRVWDSFLRSDPGRPPEVLRDRLADERCDGRAAPACLILELAILAGRKPKVGHRVLAHDGMTISRYRDSVKGYVRSKPCCVD
jgi:hypothetical protein